MSSRAEIVVVGAGLAGLSAATRLAAAGMDLHVLEAGAHAGGRLATESIDGFLVDELATSSRYLDLVWRSFVRGSIGPPAAGMQAVGAQLAGRLDAGHLHLRTAVRAVTGGSVVTDAGRWTADAVVVATDPGTAAQLLPGVEASAPRQVTSHFHVLPESPGTSAADRAGHAGRPAGQQRGGVRRPTPLQPRPTGPRRELHARRHPGGRGSRRDRSGARRRAGRSGAPPVRHGPRRPAGGRPPLQLRRPVDLGNGPFVCGDHRDTPSIQGAMASGARADRAVLRRLRTAAPPDDRSTS